MCSKFVIYQEAIQFVFFFNKQDKLSSEIISYNVYKYFFNFHQSIELIIDTIILWQKKFQ